MFGEYVKGKRLDRGLSLREFCKKAGEDPSNWSKVERGLIPPPQDIKKMEAIAATLGILEEPSVRELHEMAIVDAGNIPDYIMNNRDIVENLPAFLRTIDNVKPTRDEFEKLIELLRTEG